MNNPYPHEHSIRIEQPSKERFSRFRRVNDQFGKGISAIWGVLRRKIGNRSTELQALRFDAKKFTPAMVRKWIDSHGGRKLGLVIESATDYGKVGEVYRGNPKRKSAPNFKTGEEHSAYLKGLRDGQYGFTYIDPNWSKEVLNAWAKGFEEARKVHANPMSKLDVAAWLEAAYHEEKKGIVEYEKLLGYIKDVPEYAGVKRLLKRIIRDEKRHVNALANILKF